MYRTDKYSQHSSTTWPVWLNGWVFIYELNDCGLESCCNLLKLLLYMQKNGSSSTAEW